MPVWKCLSFEKLAVYIYSKTCVKRSLKIEKIQILIKPGSLMKVEHIA